MANNFDNQELDNTLLEFAAARAANWPHLFSSVITRYLALNNLTERDLYALLHCDKVTLNHLRLCGRPDADPSAFALDIQRVADKLGLDAGLLASIVREVDAADAFTKAGRGASPFSSTSGMLKAARDHEEGLVTSDQLSGSDDVNDEENTSDALISEREDKPNTDPLPRKD